LGTKTKGGILDIHCLGITGAMRTAPTAAMEVLLGLPPLHLQVEAEARIGNTDYAAIMSGNPNWKVVDMHTCLRT
jgi:hypothetical protein